jgi:hypothetical protein
LGFFIGVSHICAALNKEHPDSQPELYLDSMLDAYHNQIYHTKGWH